MKLSFSGTEILTSAGECFAPPLGPEAECHKFIKENTHSFISTSSVAICESLDLSLGGLPWLEAGGERSFQPTFAQVNFFLGISLWRR